MIKTKYSVDASTGTATFEVYSNGGAGELITTYSYDDATGTVSMTERATQTVVTLEDLDTFIEGTLYWVDSIRKEFAPVLAYGRFEYKMKKTANKVKYEYYGPDDLQICDAEYKVADGTITFEPRAAVTIALSTLLSHAEHLLRYQAHVRQF